MANESQIYTHRSPSQMAKFAERGIRIGVDQVEQAYAELREQGICISQDWLRQSMGSRGMDSLDSIPPLGANVTPGSVTTPLQKLQSWLPGFVSVVTKARNIDRLIGITTVGAWADEEVVFGVSEPQGYPVAYTDWGNVPFAGNNATFERRTVVRFEQGFFVGTLEEERASRINMSTAAQKRSAAALELQIARNEVGFVGVNSGGNRTYGFLNDPGLPAYITAPNGASGSPTWASKTFLEITHDIIFLGAQLQNNSGGVIAVGQDATVLALGTAQEQYLSVTNALGTQSVRSWLRETYPRMRVESAPELDLANGGANVVYLYAERIDDDGLSQDDGAVWLQPVPAQFVTLGVERQSKRYVEDFTNATAGAILKRPFAVQRMTGI